MFPSSIIDDPARGHRIPQPGYGPRSIAAPVRPGRCKFEPGFASRSLEDGADPQVRSNVHSHRCEDLFVILQ